MKKKIIRMFCGFFLVVITGCAGKENIWTKDMIGSYKYEKTIICDAFKENIKYFENNFITINVPSFDHSKGDYRSDYRSDFFITDSNDVYVYDLEKKYSVSNMNCLKLDKKVNIIHKDYIEERQTTYTKPVFYLDENFNEVFIDSGGLTIQTERADYILYHEPLYNFLTLSGYTKYQSQDLTGYDEWVYAINGDNKIYSFQANVRDEYNNVLDNPKIENTGIVFSASEDEVVQDFLFKEIESEFDNSFVRTNKGYYKPTVINEKECSEYKDIKCVYQLLYDEEISKEINNIVFINNIMIITKDGDIYYNSNLPKGE